MKTKIMMIIFSISIIALTGCSEKGSIIGGCDQMNWNDEFCIDKIPDLPEEIGDYKLEPFSKKNWGENCAELDGKEYCLRSVRAEYFNKEQNIAIHIMPRDVTKGRKSTLHDQIVEKYSGEDLGSGVYRLEEEHELYWAPSEGFDQIMVQEYSYDYTTSGKRSISRRADPDNPVVKYYLEEYPAEIE